MKFISKLIPFDDSNSPDVHIEASLAQAGDKLKLTYQILEGISQVFIPKNEDEHKRVIGLWESTCFECFIKNPAGDNYYEFNFSPEGHWDCFYFNKPGDKLKECEIVNKPTITPQVKEDKFYINIEIDLKTLKPEFWCDKAMEFGLTTVLENQNNELSYWALKHLDDRPNFHNFGSFELIEKSTPLQ